MPAAARASPALRVVAFRLNKATTRGFQRPLPFRIAVVAAAVNMHLNQCVRKGGVSGKEERKKHLKILSLRLMASSEVQAMIWQQIYHGDKLTILARPKSLSFSCAGLLEVRRRFSGLTSRCIRIGSRSCRCCSARIKSNDHRRDTMLPRLNPCERAARLSARLDPTINSTRMTAYHSCSQVIVLRYGIKIRQAKRLSRYAALIG